MHRRPSATLWLSGFSTYTSLPAWHAQIVMSACQWFGVAIEIASSDLSSRALRTSGMSLGTGRFDGFGGGALGAGFFLLIPASWSSRSWYVRVSGSMRY